MREKWIGTRFSSNNLGLMIAVFAGVISIATAVWPGAPQYAEFDNILWVLVTIAVGIGFIAAAVLADRSVTIARSLLIGGAIVRIGSGLIFGGMFADGLSAGVLDIVPAVMALVAATIVGPRERGGVP